MRFQPIAIIGQSCILPGALSPEQLWDGVSKGLDLISTVPSNRWGVPLDQVVNQPGPPEGVWTTRGGFVTGFDAIFNPNGLLIPREQLAGLDPVALWVLHGAREALKSAGYGDHGHDRGALIIGNLSYPSAGLAAFAEKIWQELAGFDRLSEKAPGIDPRNRFCSGFPALFAAKALGLSQNSLCLDAACASSLYAIKLASERLHSGQNDFIVAGAVNCTEGLMIHMGFKALGAVSPTGQSRPFHREADGLIPAEGAAFVVLRRLEDAVSAGQKILGVIRGLGLSNDGRSGSFLVPSEEGQFRAIRAAYDSSGVSPADISLVECHATGTQLGDATEIRSMGRVYEGRQNVPIGSLKSNLGHLITASGVAGLLKVLGALKAGMRPPTLHAEQPLEAISRSPFRVLAHSEPWDSDHPRRAAISSFGFGGNNAHLIVEEWEPSSSKASYSATSETSRDDQVAIVGIGVIAANAMNLSEFRKTLFNGATRVVKNDDGIGRGKSNAIFLSPKVVRFPPKDLEETLPQQLFILKAAQDAVADAGTLPTDRTSVFVGMQCDANAARYFARWRLASFLRQHAGSAPDRESASIAEAQGAIAPVLTAAGAIGEMPNIPANRINNLFNFQGPSFTVSSEEISGLSALEIAKAALRNGEIDAALVGAVDLCCEPVHEFAEKEILIGGAQVPGDAAVMLVLKRLTDAQKDGNRVYAILSETGSVGDRDLKFGVGTEGFDLKAQFGHSHAAAGLLHVAAAALASYHRVIPNGPGQPASPWLPGLAPRKAVVAVRSFTGASSSTAVSEFVESATPALLVDRTPTIHCFSGPDRAAVLHQLKNRAESEDGPAKLVIVAADEREFLQKKETAAALLSSVGGAISANPAEGVFYCDEPIGGELAFVFTFAATAYPGMGREVVMAVPEIIAHVGDRFRGCAQTIDWIYSAKPLRRPDSFPDPMRQLRAYSFLCHAHAFLSQEILGLKPNAAIGLCTGESSSLFSLGAWTNPEEMFGEIERSGLYSRYLAGEFESVRKAWEPHGITGPVRWANWRVFAPLEDVQKVLANEQLAHLLLIHAPGDCIIGGHVEACDRVIGKLGPDRAKQIKGGMALHCPEVESFADTWREIHRRHTNPLPGVRFYTNAQNTHYRPDSNSAADAITRQALGTVDFPKTVINAWNDGVRVFVEHGPRALCSEWISQTLADKKHLAISLDYPGRSSLKQTVYTTAQLLAAGVSVRHQTLSSLLSGKNTIHLANEPVAQDERGWIKFEAHKPVRFPARNPELSPDMTTHKLNVEVQVMEPCPWLPPVLAKPLARHLENAGAKPPNPAQGISRTELETLSSGKVSAVFGALFEAQDQYVRQVRMPMPPLLLADRVTKIEGEPRSMKLGAMWTETDIRPDSWYLHQGCMPTGIMIESGQADLLLISWLGVDFLNKGERIYRLLGCEISFHGGLPRPGETLKYEIHVDGHAKQDEVRLFFFHYDCFANGIKRITMRGGQAGFFTDEELANSNGIIWSPETAEHPPQGTLDPPVVQCSRNTFTLEQVKAFSEGNVQACFGPGFEHALTHVRTPRIQNGRMLFLEEVTHFDPSGGPWKRGYLRSVAKVKPDLWYFEGHFKNDPCMPGTLMFEACLQAMAFYMTALGHTLERDGWRFEPIPDEKYRLTCRGQVTPSSRELIYEVFVREVHAGPIPMLYADVLCTVDGLKAFHCARMGLQLTPDWPLNEWRHLLEHHRESKPIAKVGDFEFGYRALLASAWGRPSEAFGKSFDVFDGSRIISRLPGPPYHFMTRVLRVTGDMASMKVGSQAEIEYDIPDDAWYFSENGAKTMPYCVLLEAALQPCGWLAVFTAPLPATTDQLHFRNLDGTGTLLAEIPPGSKTLTTVTTLTQFTRLGSTMIVGFDVVTRLAGKEVFSMKTVFGFFPNEALENQVGLPVSPEEKAQLNEPANCRIELKSWPERYFSGAPRLPGKQLFMLDRITGIWPDGGRFKLGRVRAEKDVNPKEWFFKSHFFQDPVQPGSLGIEAMLQLLQFYMIERGIAAGISNPKFEPIALEEALTWKYRGQVLPKNKRVTVELEVQKIIRDSRGVLAIAEAWYYVDGIRIYHAKNLGMRIVSGGEFEKKKTELSQEIIFDPDRETWVKDHRPTYTVPTLPMMTLVNMLAEAAQAEDPSLRVVRIENVHVKRWAIVDGPLRLKTQTRAAAPGLYDVTLLVWREASRTELSRFEPLASGIVHLKLDYPTQPGALTPLRDVLPAQIPYQTAELSHGPAFHLLQSLKVGANGSLALLNATGSHGALGLLNHILLDGTLHGIPHNRPGLWAPEIQDNVVAYPSQIIEMNIYASAPTSGEVTCEARFEGFSGGALKSPIYFVRALAGGKVWIEYKIVELIFPKGSIGRDPSHERRAFLENRVYFPGRALSTFEKEAALLTDAEVKNLEWLPGTIKSVYRTTADASAFTAEICVKDHIARITGEHPSRVHHDEKFKYAWTEHTPLTRRPIQIEHEKDRVRVLNAGSCFTDMSLIMPFWKANLGGEDYPITELYHELARRFVSGVRLIDPDAIHALKGKSAIFLANHQVQVESVLITTLGSGLIEGRIVVLANAKHRSRWIGQLLASSFSYPGMRDPKVIKYFEQKDPASIFNIVKEINAETLDQGKSFMLHVDGTRQTSCRQKASRVSSIFIELALSANLPIVPIRFSGGLPVEPLTDGKLEFPVGYCGQEYRIGSPIHPDELRRLNLLQQKERVLGAINALGAPVDQEAPGKPDPVFAAAVSGWMQRLGIGEVQAVMLALLEDTPRLGPLVRECMAGKTPPSLSVEERKWLGRFVAWLSSPAQGTNDR